MMALHIITTILLMIVNVTVSFTTAPSTRMLSFLPSTKNNLLCNHFRSTSSRSMSSIAPEPRGCAAAPFQKKKVAVFGTGGYLGATIFGFLQRASAIYGTGISGSGAVPRGIVATSYGSSCLNKILNSKFCLAYANEQHLQLTNMGSIDYIQRALSGIDAVIIGTMYTLESRSVTGNTYAESPNDKTLEFYLDDSSQCQFETPQPDDVHLRLFENSVTACVKANIQHLVVIETPLTTSTMRKEFAKLLDTSGLAFTYIRVGNNNNNDDATTPWEATKLYTFEQGIQSKLNVDSFTLKDNYQRQGNYESGDWMDFFDEDDDDTEASRLVKSRRNKLLEQTQTAPPREDIAAVAVQILLSCDWEKSRCMRIVSNGELMSKEERKKQEIQRTDKEWCIKSELVAQALASVD